MRKIRCPTDFSESKHTWANSAQFYHPRALRTSHDLSSCSLIMALPPNAAFRNAKRVQKTAHLKLIPNKPLVGATAIYFALFVGGWNNFNVILMIQLFFSNQRVHCLSRENTIQFPSCSPTRETCWFQAIIATVTRDQNWWTPTLRSS